MKTINCRDGTHESEISRELYSGDVLLPSPFGLYSFLCMPQEACTTVRV